MSEKTPEEIAALREKYSGTNEKKARAKENKKAKYSEANAQKNTPVVEVRIPYTQAWRDADGTFRRKDIDPELPPWSDWRERAERAYRFNVWLETEVWPEIPVRVKLVRTESDGEEALRRLYGSDIVFREVR